jgi:hypothetical protein
MRHGPLIAATAAVLLSACSDRPQRPAITAPSNADIAAVPAVPDDSSPVYTPAGVMPRACVHEIPNGSHVDVTGLVHLPDGQTMRFARCAARGQSAVHSARISTPPTLDGWVEYAVDVTNPLRSLSANYTVPPAPVNTYSGTKVYYSFPGVDNGHYILQPVIQYGYNGSFGGSHWTMASWQCYAGVDCFHGTPVTISTGDAITGTVVATGCSGGSCTWTITAHDATSSQNASYSFTGTDDYVNVYGGAVEPHGLTGCSDLPTNGVNYSSISVSVSGSGTITPSWTNTVASGLSPTCMFAVASTSSTVNVYHNPVFTITGVLTGEVPSLTWPSVPGATSYEVYREWFNKDTMTGSDGFEDMGSGTSGWTDPNLCSDQYYGTAGVPFRAHGSIEYQVLAIGDGGWSSEVVNFELADCI